MRMTTRRSQRAGPGPGWIRSRLTYASVMSTLAVFGVLAGGGAYAASQIGPKDIAKNAVRAKHIKKNQVRAKHVARNAVRTPKLADGAVTTSKLADGPYWRLGGNAGTDSASNFLGTADDQPLELRVDGTRALGIEPALFGAAPAPNLIGGSPDNQVSAGVHSATIAGGGRLIIDNPASANRVTDNGGTVGGGARNQAGDGAGTTSDARQATVGGGQGNTASGFGSTIGGGVNNAAAGSSGTVAGGQLNLASGSATAVGGGLQNTASGDSSAVGGGEGNTASGFAATVGGGADNSATALAATVPGGRGNLAGADYTFAAGRKAQAVHPGTFVWADSNNFDFGPSRADQFRARATGGVEFITGITSTGASDTGVFVSPGGGAWQTRSDRRSKRDLRPVDAREVLRRLAAMPVSTWSWRTQDAGIRHMGPTAQDFRGAFGLGQGRRTISTVDADGVALAAIQGLNRKLGAERAQRRELERRIARLERRLSSRGEG